MDFGKAIPYQRPRKLKSRGLWGDITGAVKHVGDDIKKGVDDVVDGVKNVASDVESVAKTAATDVVDVAKDVGNVLTGSIDFSKSVSFGMNAGTPNKKTQLFTDK